VRFYHSGTPRNDKYQPLEDSLCDHRLYSLHGDYYKAVLKWVEALPPDRTFRPYPKTLLLDSGAFTAWNAGVPTTLEEVTRSYDGIISRVKGKFEDLICINLDVIPGERGRDPTPDEILRGFEESDKNFYKLVERFGPCILPVFHQNEENIAPERLKLVCDQADYICLSPRNDLHEGLRHAWSVAMHQEVFKIKPTVKTHGLATTGNSMIRDVPWFSVDSAAWVLHGGMAGKVDFYDPTIEGKPRYRNFFFSDDSDKQKYDKIHERQIEPVARERFLKSIEDLGFTLEQLKKDSRARSLVCMRELSKFFELARERQDERIKQGKETWQPSIQF
jgi:hypothetical protein